MWELLLLWFCGCSSLERIMGIMSPVHPPATSEWIQFFKEAGIPPGPAVNYAVMFVDNR